MPPLIYKWEAGGSREGAGRGAGKERKGCGLLGWDAGLHPARIYSATAGSYSHFVGQPRVRRQRDLKGNLGPEKERKELRAGSGIRIGEDEGKHLHGEAGLD